jgi:hypothetical protein
VGATVVRGRPYRMRRSPATLLAVAAVLGAGCGFGGDGEVTERVQQPALLTRTDVERQPVGSPQRTMLEWWRTLQFDNPIVAAGFYSRKLGITPSVLESQLQFGAGALGLVQRPKLVEVERHGNRAVVFALLENKSDNPNGRVDTVRTARSFNLVREGDKWKLAENLYLERQARIQRFFRRAARSQADPPRRQAQRAP